MSNDWDTQNGHGKTLLYVSWVGHYAFAKRLGYDGAPIGNCKSWHWQCLLEDSGKITHEGPLFSVHKYELNTSSWSLPLTVCALSLFKLRFSIRGVFRGCFHVLLRYPELLVLLFISLSAHYYSIFVYVTINLVTLQLAGEYNQAWS